MTSRKSPESSAKQAKRTSRRREQTRAEILETAREVVLRDGYSDFSLAAVALEMGLTKPALYYYFASKKALITELVVAEWIAAAEAVHAAVEQTETGADAIEQLMRTLFARYRDKLDLFLLVHQQRQTEELRDLVGPDELRRVRPANELFYGGAEERLRVDQRAGIFPADRDPRLFAFTAHTTAQGLLTMKAMAEGANDPLLHADDDLIEDVCRTYRIAAGAGGTR